MKIKNSKLKGLSKCEIKQLVRYELEREYCDFKVCMLKKSASDVYESCNTVRFYECLHEYFCYNEHIPMSFYKKAVKLIYRDYSIMNILFELYIKYEELSLDSWTCISGLIDEFVNPKE